MDFLLPFDTPILCFIQDSCHNPVTDAVFPFLTYLGECGACWLFLSLIFLFMKKYRRAGVLMLAAMLLGVVLGEGILKNVICRPRPFQHFGLALEALLIDPPSGWSFPSGHSCASFAAATALFLQHRKEGMLAYVLAFLIAFSRVFLLVHFPSDVLAGALLGVLLALISTAAYNRWVEPRLGQYHP